MRARMAIHYAQQTVELREVVLRNKPPELWMASSKGTVPVLVLQPSAGESPFACNALNEKIQNNAGQVIDESLEIMQWALNQHDPKNWLAACNGQLANSDLITRNDTEFKPNLDKYKYFDRYPEATQDDYLALAKPFLVELNERISANHGYLSGPCFSASDAAILPFVRQFSNCDTERFNKLGLQCLGDWLGQGVASSLFVTVMSKYPAWSAADNNAVVFSA